MGGQIRIQKCIQSKLDVLGQPKSANYDTTNALLRVGDKKEKEVQTIAHKMFSQQDYRSH